MATLDDIAEAVGVSSSTVSRVLNGRSTAIAVSPRARQRILEVAAQLHYRPNIFARGLRSKRTQIIGIAIRDLTYLFWSGIIKGINDICSSRGYHVILSNTTNKDQAEETASMLLRDLGVDGVLVAGDFVGDDATIERILERCPHMVAICRSVDPNIVPVLRVDDRRGMLLLLEYLYGLGHRRIGFVGLKRPGAFTVRYGVYQEFMVGHNLPVPEALTGLIEGELYFPTTDEFIALGTAATRRILTSGESIDALVCGCDALALGALAAAREVGLVVPRDLSVAGFDDAPFAHYCTPTLTTIQQPTVQMGQRAADLLINLIEGTVSPPTEIVLFEPDLIVRGSTASPSRDDRSQSIG